MTVSTRSVEGTDWRRLSARVIWVDLARSILTMLPTVIAVAFVGVEPSFSTLWPLLLVAGWGTFGAIADVIRWAFTRYRVTPSEIERRTGLFVRRHRSVRRDRIRSVDTSAKLRHRITGLRVVSVGAGQNVASGEAALDLDALTKADAALLREELLGLDSPAPMSQGSAFEEVSAEPVPGESATVIATFRPWWVVYNMFSIWAYLTAAGLLWGAFWLATTFGVDLWVLSSRLFDWESLGWMRGIGIALVAGGLIGAIGMGLNFLAGYWRFELARVRTPSGSFLRTRRGLFSTREVNRDESRMRGMTISEPVLWRWMRMADTQVITTGLSIWDAEQPSSILPRGPRSVAFRAARQVFGEDSPIGVPLARHPRAALRRRLWWATASALVLLGAIGYPLAVAAVPLWLLWVLLGYWLLALLAAVIAYRALGHTIHGAHLVVRSGLLSRATTALRRDAVSTIAVRQSILQRRLGLATVSAMTAAGWSIYEALDVAERESVAFAAQAAPGLIDEFLAPAAVESGK